MMVGRIFKHVYHAVLSVCFYSYNLVHNSSQIIVENKMCSLHDAHWFHVWDNMCENAYAYYFNFIIFQTYASFVPNYAVRMHMQTFKINEKKEKKMRMVNAPMLDSRHIVN